MKSMTGYGKGTAERDGRKLTFEIKSVNNRYLEIACRVPKNMMACDEIVRRSIQSRIKRGAVDVFFCYEDNSESTTTVSFDSELAQKLTGVAALLSSKLGIRNDFDCAALMRTPDIITIEATKDDGTAFTELALEAIEAALDSLETMRSTEGEAIKKDLLSIARLMEVDTEFIDKRWPKMVEEYQQKTTARIKELLGGVELDEAKLINEVAFFADKADLNEELQRLSSHFAQFRDCLEQSDAVGRKLDFIAQEMNREINTIGSKSSDIQITGAVLNLKTNLEKIREQIRNVE